MSLVAEVYSQAGRASIAAAAIALDRDDQSRIAYAIGLQVGLAVAIADIATARKVQSQLRADLASQPGVAETYTDLADRIREAAE